MTSGFRYHPEASKELDLAIDWYEAATPGLGPEFFDDVESAVREVRTRPAQWPLDPGVSSSLGVRRRLLRRFPYSLAWVVEPGMIVIVAVVHSRRLPGYWLDRTRPGTG